mgnify:CR=1 FL=1
MMTKADEKNKLSESEVQLEYEEELNDLEYSGNNETPSFDMIRVTKKDFSIYELYRKYKKQQLVLDVEFQRKYVWGDSRFRIPPPHCVPFGAQKTPVFLSGGQPY